MGASFLAISISVIVLFTGVLLGLALIKHKFRVVPEIKSGASSNITWDSGCPGIYNETSKGTDLTERLLELGAPVLPENCRYGFFPTLEIQNPNPQFAILSDTYTDCIAVVYKVRGEKPLIAFYGINALAKDRENEILMGAEQAHKKFMGAYGKHIARKEFERFIESGMTRPNDELMRLSDTEREWVEDN